MFKLSSYILNNVLRRTIVYFALVLFALNIGLVLINNAYEEEALLQKEDSFIKIIDHISSENSLSYVIEYVEHYGHIHNSSINLYESNVLVYSSHLQGENFNTYTLEESNLKIEIDNSLSNSAELSNMMSIITNLVVLTSYIVWILIFYITSKRKADIIINDLNTFSTKMKKYDLEEYSFTFLEFKDVFDEFVSINKELHDFNLLKKEKLQSVKHDLNTSMTVIKSYIEGFNQGRMELNSDESKELLEEIEFNIDLITQLGEEDSRMLTHVNLTKIIERVASRFDNIFSSKNISLELDLQNNVKVLGNDSDITRVIHNVLSNAFYYSEDNTKVIMKIITDDNIKVIIQDQGIGIEKTLLNQVFIKEFRGESAREMNSSGKGIGLYTSKALMKEMNGDIEISSSHEGTLVTLIFSS